MAKKSSGGLLSDAQFRKFASAFFEGADAAKVSSDELGRVDPELQSYRFSDEGAIVYGTDLSLKLFALMEYLSKRLTATMFNRQDIETEVWRLAETSNDVENKIRLLAIRINENNERECIYYIPCYVIRLPARAGVSLKLGPITIRRNGDVDAELAAHKTRARIEIGPEKDFGIREVLIYVNFPPNIWEVVISASRSNIREEAIWLANVATSLIRLYLMIRGQKVAFAPREGSVEVHPVYPFKLYKTDLTLLRFTDKEGKNLSQSSAGGMNIPGMYEVNDDALEYLRGKEREFSAILAAADDTLGQRLAQGLGWLAKCRQSSDQSERLLYAFTALEALLSSTTASDPVTQTISRYYAAIMQPDPTKRSPIAAEIGALYGQRSNVVHRGSRNVTDLSARKIQYYVEQVFCCVLQNGAPNTKHDAFLREVKEASYGSKWPSDADPLRSAPKAEEP